MGCGKIGDMDRNQIIDALRRNQISLRGLGVESLALFGSVARGEAGAESDIDLAATYNEAIVKDLFDLGGVAAAIESYLGTHNFDLADEQHLHPHVRQAFLQDHVRIF